MSRLCVLSIIVTIVSAMICMSLAVSLTFELPDNDKLCFYENIERGQEATLMFQVLSGGNNDVDMELSDPNGQYLYRDIKKEYDTHTWNVKIGGVYKFCFSNEFSTFTHKIVYFHLQVGEEQPAVGNVDNQENALTLIEVSAVTIFTNLNKISEFQTYHRLGEVQGRSFAENLNEQVLYWSIGESLIVIFVGIGQIMVLRSFFSNTRKTSVAT